MKIRNYNLLIFAFVFLLPLKGLLQVDQNILGVVSPDNLAAIFLVLFWLLAKGNNYSSTNKFYTIRRYSLILLYFFFAYTYYTTIKGILFLDEDSSQFIKRLVRDIINFIAIIIIIKKSGSYSSHHSIRNAILICSMLIGPSILFSEYLISIGLYPSTNVDMRYSGFLNVNPNTAGIFCAITIGYFMSIIEGQKLNKTTLVYILGICLLFLGIVGTASRTALFIFIFLLFLFAYRNLRFSLISILPISLLLLLSFFIYTKFGDILSNRVIELANDEGLATFDTRRSYWPIYLKDVFSNPSYILTGATNNIDFQRDAHNFYIKIFWEAGIIFLLIFLSTFIKIILRRQNHNLYKVSILYPTFAYLIGALTGSDLYPFWFIFIIAISGSDYILVRTSKFRLQHRPISKDLNNGK